jgi:hypothetical protein
MTPSGVKFLPSRQQQARIELERRAAQVELAKRDPLYLMSQMTAVDQRDGTRFSLEHLRTPLDGEATLDPDGYTLRSKDGSWRWQRYVAERSIASKRLIVLKGRQIGVTWIVLAADVAEAILKPGTASLLFRQREDEAIDNIRRWWVLYQSLPEWFKEGIRVIRPDKAAQPGRDGVELLFPDGSISAILPMTSAAASGQGRTIRNCILDEAAYIELLEAIRAAVEPAAGDASVKLVSTAHGIHNPETGEGNEYSRLWHDEESGYERIFVPYDAHPERNEVWYETAPEVRSLRPYQRQMQFPRNAHEAFALSDRNFFDPDDLTYYAERVRPPKYRMDFRDGRKLAVASRARVHKSEEGLIRVYQEPREEHSYAIGCDPSTGRGRDSSAAYVVDLASGALVAEFHGRLDADLLAAQLHYLGRWYKTAWLAVERNGIGEAVIVTLRHGREGRPPYPKLYRHVMSSRPSQDMAKVYGFPMNTKTRPLVLNQLEKWVRERTLPWVTERLLFEMQTFIERDKDPSPAAQDGSHDDCVFGCAIALEMFRLHGRHPEREKRLRRKRERKPRQSMFPWEPERVSA